MKNNSKNQNKKQAFPVWLMALVILVVVGLAGFFIIQATNSNSASQPYPAEVNISQAAEKRDAGAFILDVRQPEEWVQFHIPGATLIPLGELPDRLNEVPKDKEIVVVCRTGHRSAQGRDILRNAGFEKVTSMAGGVTQWQAQGLPIATGQ
ncbi:MAG: rhodanese-like domain-containing protein [Anaerolineae bacterium]|nr:rhodanese-like domain-containing protein [Anaerolineae bacterium]